MKKAVFYGRYSSAQQTEQSIEGQLHVCEKYAEENGLDITAQYIDRAMTGTNDHRPQFLRMIADSGTGEFDVVLVYKLDRFARSRYDSAIYKRKLKDNGVKVISATEAITDTPEGIIMEALLEGMDEYYSAELARKMQRGKEESFRKGRYLEPTAPYGYKKENHKLAIDEVTAPTASEIFQSYAGGERLSDIADKLNSTAVTNAAGGRWSNYNLSKVLHNTVYKGEYRHKPFEGFAKCPAIVSAELFEAVQARLAESRRRKRESRTGFDYKLTGRVFCAECMRHMSGNSSQRKYFYYDCDCGKSRVRAESLHKKVNECIKEYLTAEKIREIAKSAADECEPIDNTAAIKAEITAVTTKINNIVNAITSGGDIPELVQKLQKLKERKVQLERKLKAEPPQRLTQSDITETLTAIAKTDPERITDIIADKIYIHNNTVLICINLSDADYSPTHEEVLARVRCVETPPTIYKTSLFLRTAV